MNVKRTNTTIAIVFLIALPTAVIFSVSYGMAMGNDGIMEGCLFSHTNSFCPMSLFEHLDTWKSMFVANFPKTAEIFLLLLLTLFGLTLMLYALRLKLNRPSKNKADHKLYIKQKPDIPLFNYLREIFAQGILKPKIY